MASTAEAETPALEAEDLAAEFARVMHEWDCRPFRQGEVAMPSREEAAARLRHSRYARCRPFSIGPYPPLAR